MEGLSFLFSTPLVGRPNRLFSARSSLSRRNHLMPLASMKRTRIEGNRSPKSSSRSAPSQGQKRARVPELRELSSSERLHKIMAYMGVASRRKAENLIANRRVAVNGKLVTENGTFANPYTDRITVDGKTVSLPSKSMWFAIHKPKGMLSTRKEGKRSAIDTVTRSKEDNIITVAPIDEDASGLVLATNDRFWAQELSKPTNTHIQEWIVDCYGPISNAQLETLSGGIRLNGDEHFRPKDVVVRGTEYVQISRREKGLLSRVELRFRGCRSRIVRRLFEAAGLEIFSSSRRTFGLVHLSSLKRGDSRSLTPNEIKALKRKVSDKTLARG